MYWQPVVWRMEIRSGSGIFVDRFILGVCFMLRTLPYKMLHQTHQIKEICWITHPGSNISEAYLATLQEVTLKSTISREVSRKSKIDIFLTRSLPLFSSTICATSLSVNRWGEVACVLNGQIRDQPHIPEGLPENEIVSCPQQSGDSIVMS